MAKKKQSKASKEASAKLRGEQTAKGREAVASSSIETSRTESFLNKPIGPGIRLTWRAVFMFMILCLILDIGLFALFHMGFDSCYAILCAFE